MIEPAYQGLEADDVTLLSSADGGALVRIIAGDVRPPRPGSTHTPMAFMHASIAPGALLELPWDPGFTRSSISWPAPAGSGATAARLPVGSS